MDATLISLIKDVGVPAVIALYTLAILRSELDQLRKDFLDMKTEISDIKCAIIAVTEEEKKENVLNLFSKAKGE